MLRVWTKRLGQKHYTRDGMTETLCGMPMLGTNCADVISESEQKECEECLKVLEKERQEQQKEWLEFQWNYIESVKDLKKMIEALPDNSEVKKDVRMLFHSPTNKYIVQFREHDFS